jgi:hypothetical protein
MQVDESYLNHFNPDKLVVARRSMLQCKFCFDVSLFPELGLECLATWKDGSDTFFYGVFASEGLVTKEDTYRCFVSLLINGMRLLVHKTKPFLSYFEGLEKSFPPVIIDEGNAQEENKQQWMIETFLGLS